MKKEDELHKFCPGCKFKLPTLEFCKNKDYPDGLNTYCRGCAKRNRKKYYEANKDKICFRARMKYPETKEKTLENNRIWREKNKDRRREYMRNYNRGYEKEKRKNDICFRLRKSLSTRVHHALKGLSKSSPTMELIGCSIEELKRHLEKSFKPEMAWANYGKDWHTDHIKPCKLFNLIDPEEQKKCFHYTNLQPLWATTKIAREHGDFESIGNINKNDKYNE